MNIVKSLVAVALVACVAMAGTPNKWSYGVTGSINLPTSPALKEVTNNSQNYWGGLGGGLHLTYKLDKKQAVRVRSEYIGYPTAYTKYSNVYTLGTKANVINGEVDYMFYPAKHWYVAAGVGVSHWQNQYHGYYPKYFGRKDYLMDASVTQPLVTVGTGYEVPVNKFWVKNVALEVRYLATQLASSAKSNAVQAGVVVTF